MTIKRVTETGDAGVNPLAVEIPPVGAPSVLVHGGTGETVDTGHDALVLGTLLRRILEDDFESGVPFIELQDEQFGGHLFIDGDWPLTPAERAAVERVLRDE